MQRAVTKANHNPQDAEDSCPAMFDAIVDFLAHVESDLINPKTNKPYLSEIRAEINSIASNDQSCPEKKILEAQWYILETYLDVLANEGLFPSRLRKKLEEMMNTAWLLNMESIYGLSFEKNRYPAYFVLIKKIQEKIETGIIKNLTPQLPQPLANPKARRKNKVKITSTMVFGDSNSDRGTIAKRKLFGFIPTDGLSGLKGKSPKGRFTNGYVWLDVWATTVAEHLIIQELKQARCVFHQHIPLSKALYCPHNSYRNSYVIDEFAVNGEKHLFYIDDQNKATPVKELTLEDEHYISSFMGNKHSHHLTEGEKDEIEKSLGIKLKSRPGMRNDEIDDAIESKDNILLRAAEASFSLNDDKQILYKGKEFITTFCEGGLTADDWSDDLTSIKFLFPRKILSNLDEKRKEAIQQDLTRGISQKDKDQRLNIIWAGANDLITVNEKPTYDEAYFSVMAIERDLREKIKYGDRNFVLCNLPDLSLMPRFKDLSKAEKDNISKVTQYFNKLLQETVDKMNDAYPDYKIVCFDVYAEYNKIYESIKNLDKKKDSPASILKLQKDKLETPYLASPDFKAPTQDQKISPENGYFSYDGLHAPADIHAYLAELPLQSFLGKHFDFQAPEFHPMQAQELVDLYVGRYKREKEKAQNHFFSCHKNFAFLDALTQSGKDDAGKLQMILHHAFERPVGLSVKNRTRKILEELKWLDGSGNANKNYPCVLNIVREMKSTPATVFGYK